MHYFLLVVYFLLLYFLFFSPVFVWGCMLGRERGRVKIRPAVNDLAPTSCSHKEDGVSFRDAFFFVVPLLFFFVALTRAPGSVLTPLWQ